MSQAGTEARERTVQAITRRNMLVRRIKRTQRRMASLQGGARQALEVSLVADQTALSEAIQMVEAVKAEVLDHFKAEMREDVERVRRKSEEALRLKAEWQNRQFLPFSSGSIPPSPSQALGLLMIFVTMFAIVGIMVLLNR